MMHFVRKKYFTNSYYPQIIYDFRLYHATEKYKSCFSNTLEKQLFAGDSAKNNEVIT